ncbi:right-handed parallel beta-helix repeat-containing protein [Massilia sp. ST3]|uniref:right-handed parallel beta-helix repeat-containing protein n=1 Tax=Massilia sp. ST3 TaxID=2824903 RepID=UPI001B833007|nr:right-handed parallel beta-helix repeat-containing protein [Massilia sp. ST3]MBQ5946912.1 right-handed parallel beta-helix repeat-containing protein [Massilia sp. ST3]
MRKTIQSARVAGSPGAGFSDGLCLQRNQTSINPQRQCPPAQQIRNANAGRRVPGPLLLARWSCHAGLAVLLAACSPGKHLYVAPGGADTNPGTKAAPFRTIARADAAASPGYTIHVAPGVYEVSAPTPHSAGIGTSRSGTSSARIKFVSDLRWGAKIVVSGTGIAWRAKGSHVDIEGFDISGSGRHGIVADGAHLSITNNLIHDLAVSGGCTGAGGAAIDTDGGPGHVLIKGNVIRNIGAAMIGRCNTVQGIYIANPHNTVVNNIVSGVAAAGIQQWHGATDSSIVNNTVFRCKIGILIGGGDAGALPEGSRNNYVANNIVYDNIAYGIVEGGKVGDNNRYIDNLVHSSGTALRVGGQVSGTITEDPQFLNYQADGSGDYRLKRGSPGLLVRSKAVDGAARIAHAPGETFPQLGAYHVSPASD